MITTRPKETTMDTTTREGQAAHDASQAAAYGRLQAAAAHLHQMETTARRTEGWMARHAERAAAQIPAAREALAEARAEYDGLAARYTGWSRFFLVTNGNGHVHSSLACATCYATTEYAWITTLSGATEDEAVAEYGEKMCTVCYPSAPTDERYRRPGRIDREAAEAKAAEKAAKAAAKLEKALLPDGTALHLSDYDAPKTLIAGQRALSARLDSLLWYGAGHPSARGWQNDVALLVEAIAAKTGRNPNEVAATAQAKAEKKHARETA